MVPTISRNLSTALLPNSHSTMQAALARAMGLGDIDELYNRSAAHPDGLVSGVLAQLSVHCRIDGADNSATLTSGPVIAVANHPTGLLDGLVLAHMLCRIRNDVKILANELIAAVPDTKRFTIPVDVYHRPGSALRNIRALRQCLKHVKAGGLLVVFPAGEVSRFCWHARSVTDPEWNSTISRLIRTAACARPDLNVVPIHIDARNSALFHLAGIFHSAVRTALLPRQLLNKRGAGVTIRVGRAISSSKISAIESDSDAIAYLRWRTYLLENRQNFKAHTSRPLRRAPAVLSAAPVASPVRPELLRDEVEALRPDHVYGASDGLRAYIATAAEIPSVLAEIGRLREITFRKAGEGTGRAVDLDRFDQHYLHLFLWSEPKEEIAGAYRLARTDVVHVEHGIRGLYTATLFDYGAAFLERMGPALELGRSWVRAEYQRSFAPLLLLWKAIGRFVARHPKYKILFGPVSISNTYQQASRELLVSFLERRAALNDWLGLVSSRTPFLSRRSMPEFPGAQLDIEELSTVIGDIEPDGRGVPVLLRHYLKLGGRLLGFNIDPDFSNALDGLIVVDLTRTEPKLLQRYLGRNEAAEFLKYQKGAYVP
jgi:putative hemolysin